MNLMSKVVSLVGMFGLMACGQQHVSTPSSATGIPLKEQLENVACVKSVHAEQVSGLNSENYGSTGNWMVTVKEEYTAAACADEIRTAIAGVNILNIMPTLKVIHIAGDTIQ